jgi:glycosyltransferase involved in cell wall biosynthesis
VRLLHVSNIVSHHQLPLARCFARSLGNDNFRFAATLSGLPDRQLLKWDMHSDEPWILRAGDNSKDRRDFEYWWDEADVVLCGERLFRRMRDRVAGGRLTFHMTERWWKPPIGMARLLYPPYAWMALGFLRLAASRHFHFLSTGGYASSDIKRIAQFPGRIWDWGYFTQVPDPLPSTSRTSQEFRILWAGRMIGWKRVETLLKAFASVHAKFSRARLTIVGQGPREHQLKNFADRLLEPGCYEFLPAMPPPDVLELMKSHHAYVLPSTGTEGWGAVVNESMIHGCAIVATHATGSAKSLIRDRTNGLLFTPGDADHLSQLLCELIENPTFRTRLVNEAQRTMVQSWSPMVASERFLAACTALLANQPVPSYSEGPMTPVWDKRL